MSIFDVKFVEEDFQNYGVPTIVRLLKDAKKHYPESVYYIGVLSELEINLLRDSCEVHCSNVQMRGKYHYEIRYKNLEGK